MGGESRGETGGGPCAGSRSDGALHAINRTLARNGTQLQRKLLKEELEREEAEVGRAAMSAATPTASILRIRRLPWRRFAAPTGPIARQ